MSSIFDPTFERYITITPTGKNLRGFIYLVPIFPELIVNEQKTIHTALTPHKECMDIKLHFTKIAPTSWDAKIYALSNKYTVSKTPEKLQVTRLLSYDANIIDIEYILEKDIEQILREHF